MRNHAAITGTVAGMFSLLIYPRRAAGMLFWVVAAIALHLLALCCVGAALNAVQVAFSALLHLSLLGALKAGCALVAAYLIGFFLALIVWSVGVLAWRNALKEISSGTVAYLDGDY